MHSVKTLIVDDNASFRWQVRELLACEPDIEVVGEAADGREAIRKARESGPDLVLMDLGMSGMNGIDATRHLRREMPQVRVIILTLYDIKEYRDAAAVNGASGYVVKRSLVKDLLPAIRKVCRRQGLCSAIRV